MKNINKNRIVRALRIIMPLVAIASFLIFAPLNGIWAWIKPLPDTLQEQVDEAVDHGLDGIIVYVDRAGQPPAFYTAGWKDRAAQIPADPQALFKIGSISKLYIATAAVKMVNSGSLSLDDTLAEHLPELVGRIEYADQITLRMMLQHRSGIPNFVDHPDYPWFETLPDRDAYLGFALDEPADFEPGTDYRYSNTGYLLIGDIMDKVLGYSHHEYIHKEILEPLGLNHTYSLLRQVDSLDLVSSGYYYDVESDLKEIDHISPGGSMVATAEDVGIFLRALIYGSLLDKDEQAIYTSIYEYEHDGWLPGYHSIARYHEDIDTVVIQFVNTNGGDLELVSNVVYGRLIRLIKKEINLGG